MSEALLTQHQTQLLDELSAAVAATGVSGNASAGASAGSAAGGDASSAELGASEYEAFYQHWHHIKVRHRQREESSKRRRWEWINQMQEICGNTCSELGAMLDYLSQLDEQREDVVRKTTELHQQCEQMVQDQERLSSTGEALAERLDLFDRVADVARILDQSNAATSHPDFGTMLDQLDGSIGFLEAHYDFCQAQAYLHQFEHLRNRACISIRSVVQKALEKSMSQVEQQLHDRARDGHVDTQVFYTRFRAAALNYKPLMGMLHKRVDVHETYAATLEELEQFYAHLRIRLVSGPVTLHLQSMLHKELAANQLAPVTREASKYILDISHFERQCFEAYFEMRQPQETLRTLLEAIADIFYKALRPVVLASASIDSLREMADCLQMDILEPNQQSSRTSDLMPVLKVVFWLHKDVQERLIFRIQTYIKDEIRGYVVSSADLDYPGILFAIDPGGAGEQQAILGANADTAGEAAIPSVREFQRGWFPTMQRTLGILAKIYRVLEMSTFQGLAQEAVDICITSLKNASSLLAQRSLPQGHEVLGPFVQTIDCQLFLIKHLLILREQVAAFECDLVSNEKYFNFSNVWDALHLRLPDGLLGILKPKLQQAQVDTKKDIETELKGACETLITYLTAHITQPLGALNTQISEFLSSRGGDRMKLKDQPFMSQECLRETIAAFLANVRDRVPFAAAHIRVYLAASASSGMPASAGGDSQSTASILFKPVQIRLVDTWGRLEGLLEEWQTSEEELDALGFMRPDALRDLVSSLFDAIMEAPWAQLVETIQQVPRAAPHLGPAGANIAAPPGAAPQATESPVPVPPAEAPSASDSASQSAGPPPLTSASPAGKDEDGGTDAVPSLTAPTAAEAPLLVSSQPQTESQSETLPAQPEAAEAAQPVA